MKDLMSEFKRLANKFPLVAKAWLEWSPFSFSTYEGAIKKLSQLEHEPEVKALISQLRKKRYGA